LYRYAGDKPCKGNDQSGLENKFLNIYSENNPTILDLQIDQNTGALPDQIRAKFALAITNFRPAANNDSVHITFISRTNAQLKAMVNENKLGWAKEQPSTASHSYTGVVIGFLIPPYLGYFAFSETNPSVVGKTTLNVAMFIDQNLANLNLLAVLADVDQVASASRTGNYLTLRRHQLEGDWDTHFKAGARRSTKTAYLAAVICHELWHIIAQKSDNDHESADSAFIDSSRVQPNTNFSRRAQEAIISGLKF
jgi:hypothetical protein